MTVNNSRSNRQSLLEGSTDGKYVKARPDTITIPGLGNDLTVEYRSDLNRAQGYAIDETPHKNIPGQL